MEPRRANIVCVGCHARKVKCDLQDAPDGICHNCRRGNVKCIRRDGVRKKRRTLGRPRDNQPIAIQSPVSVYPLSPASRVGVVTSAATYSAHHASSAQQDSSPPTSHRSCLITNDSLLAYDPVCDPTQSESLAPRIPSARDAILRITQADVLPPPALRQALKDAFAQHLAPFFPVLEPGDLSDPGASVLVQQTVCLAGSLTRHDQKGLLLAYEQYEKVKTLLHVDYESDSLALLKTFCILSCWSPASPHLVTLDGPWHWTGMASRMAVQLGLYAKPLHGKDERSACHRRILCHIHNSEILMGMCWDRLPGLRAHEHHLQPLTVDDFATKDISALVSIHLTSLLGIITTIVKLNRKKELCSGDISQVLRSLSNWQRNLPNELRPYSVNSTRKPFHLASCQIFICYFTAIIISQMISQDVRGHWRTSAPSVLAASCTARLYDDINCREQSAHLIHVDAYFCLVAGAVLIFYSPGSPGKESERARDVDVLLSTLQVLSVKYGGARLVLAKLQQLKQDVESGRSQPTFFLNSPQSGGMEPCLPWVVNTVKDWMGELFPFPPSFCERMDLLEPSCNQRDPGLADEIVAIGQCEDVPVGQSLDGVFSLVDILDLDFDMFNDAEYQL
ncbi:hypothetical protein EDB81DRAFT_808510 [Dactylonectria macrodidyma]|uniref:Zn(2)-C6 fungal-type domain-containing protein n=1 Tax=Dactylonectria macrodidyma TaxID=307937 RepID=A0A9P9IQM5_9HYPO|nr:hypothetical protein EDB81DRAFT_808510 [Dactylonectria macrodidyma]